MVFIFKLYKSPLKEAKKSVSLLPELPEFGRKAIPLQGCAFLPEESWPGCALRTHPDIPGDALQLFTYTEKDQPFTA